MKRGEGRGEERRGEHRRRWSALAIRYVNGDAFTPWFPVCFSVSGSSAPPRPLLTLRNLEFWSSSTRMSSSYFFILASAVTFSSCSFCLPDSSSSSCSSSSCSHTPTRPATDTQTDTRTHTQTQTQTHTDTDTQTDTHTHRHTNTHRYKHQPTDTHTHTHTNIHTQTHTHTHTHTPGSTFLESTIQVHTELNALNAPS